MTSTTDSIRELLLSRIRDVADYPKPGVMFKDITPLLADPVAFTALTDALAQLCVRHGATKIVGLEARGFILAAPVAVRAGIGFIPVRKAGKLPGATLSQSYELEYGSAEIEIHAEDLDAEDRVMVIDDVLATGGTAGPRWSSSGGPAPGSRASRSSWSSASSRAGTVWSRASQAHRWRP